MNINISDLKTQQQPYKLPTLKLSSPLSIFKYKFNDKQRLNFFADLHLLLSAGLDLKTCFDILEDQSDKENEINKIRKVKEQIISGISLADALANNEMGSDYDFYAIQIGESTGKINEVLKEIKTYYERKISQKRIVTSAMTYPLMVLFTAILAVTFMLNVIVPMFEEVFKRFHGELPLLTQKIIGLSSWFQENYIYLILGLVLLILGISSIKNELWFKKALHKTLLTLPFIGRLIKVIHISRFCHTMSLMISARSSLMQTLGLIEKMISFIPLKEALSQTKEGIITGLPFHLSLSKSNFFEKKFTSLIKAAEEVNELDYAFNRLQTQYDEEISYKLTLVSNLLEPILIIIVGGMVAIILIAMYLPLFQLGSSIY